MDKQSCFELGYVTKAFGLQGQVTAIFDVDYPELYKKLESVLVEVNATLVPFFVSSLKLDYQDKIIIKFEDIDNQDQANELKGSKLFLPLELLPESENDDPYLHEYVGMDVLEDGKKLGEITSYSESGTQILLVMDHQGYEVLFPLIDQIVLGIDKKANQLVVKLPEGLIDVYLSE